MSLNKVMLIGNVGKDPIIRHLENGTPVASFSLATTDRFKDKTGKERELTEWHSIVCWRNLAELAEKYIQKGMHLYVEGRLRSSSWEKDGQKYYVTEIIAEDLQFLGRRETKEDKPAVTSADIPVEKPADDLPF